MPPAETVVIAATFVEASVRGRSSRIAALLPVLVSVLLLGAFVAVVVAATVFAADPMAGT